MGCFCFRKINPSHLFLVLSVCVQDLHRPACVVCTCLVATICLADVNFEINISI